jgi:CBS domain-containing protein
MNEVARFLAAHPPFGGLDDAGLVRVAASVRVAFFPAGETILRQGGPPARMLSVVRRGQVALTDGERTVDVLEEGEPFGHPSLLAETSPLFSVRALEDTLCYLIPADVADEVLGTPSGLAFLAASLRDRARASHVAAPDPRLVRVGTVLAPALVCAPDDGVRDVAVRMTERGASAAIVRDGELRGIVTDTDLRARVLAAGLDPSTPVREVMTAPVLAIPPDRLAHEALLEMLDRGLHHLPVVEGGRLVGIVSDVDLLGLERRDPFVLRAEVGRAGTVDEVVVAARRLPAAVAGLARAGVDVADLAHVTSSILDEVTRRLLALAGTALGQAPASWAWLALGSQARRERALAGDQDHALVVDDDADPDDPYFVELATLVVEELERAGIARCPSGVMASERGWRRTRSGWRAAFDGWTSEPAAKAAFVATIAFDHRQVAGELDAGPDLAAAVGAAAARPAFLWRITRLALERRPPLGLRGAVVTTPVDGRGDRVDLKEGGLLPIVDLARVFALRSGTAAVGTVERLRAAATRRAIPEATAEALEEAFRFLGDVRLAHQVRQVEAGSPPDDRLALEELGAIERGGLREAFRAIAHVQDGLRRELTSSRVR